MKNEKEKKIMAFLVATTSLPAVYRPNGYARTTTTGTPHARANCSPTSYIIEFVVAYFFVFTTAAQNTAVVKMSKSLFVYLSVFVTSNIGGG